jgi:hypothetical protein
VPTLNENLGRKDNNSGDLGQCSPSLFTEKVRGHGSIPHLVSCHTDTIETSASQGQNGLLQPHYVAGHNVGIAVQVCNRRGTERVAVSVADEKCLTGIIAIAE